MRHLLISTASRSADSCSRWTAIFIFTIFLSPTISQACTIFSAKDKKGNVWAGNNEDQVFTFNTFMNIETGTDSTFGFIYFDYGRLNDFMQGGVNEAGLFYDGNAVPPSKYKDHDKKKDFPGGANAMLKYVFKKCKTVQEVFEVFEKYRLEGLEASQLHFADKYGNLGIIVADSMWITKADYQISTNYNLCHPNKDGKTCWRFPIAERILKSKEPGLESFREICDSTSQKSIASTLYSNIHNLTTGDIWFYYGSDYNNPYKTSIKELLKKGNSRFLIYELFGDRPLVAVYKTYQIKGAEAGLRKLNEYQLPTDRKNQILKFLYSDLIVWNHYFNGYLFLSDFIKSKMEIDEVFHEILQITNSLSLFSLDKQIESKELLTKYVAENPQGEFAKEVLNQMQGVFEKDANIKFELSGYENAKSVFVDGFDAPNIQYFLIKKEGKWIGEFNLDPAEYHYIFIVDGKRVLDPKNSDIVKDCGFDANRMLVKE